MVFTIQSQICCLLVLACCAPVYAATAETDLLERGFSHMYNLSFDRAHASFTEWEKSHPQNPEGPAFDAAAYLFNEFDRLRILQSQFFASDQGFAGLKRTSPDPALKRSFEESLAQSKALGDRALSRNPQDTGALFAEVIRLGLHANYLALIQKQDFAALTEIKQATEKAEQLLRVDPQCYDAYIAIGIENYLLSLKPAPLRWFLHATGAQTDRQTGIEKLRLTATKGHYLQPYAELLLAVAALRDQDRAGARRMLSDLAARFPQNPLYREELKKIQ
jgi:hypothetical protein